MVFSLPKNLIKSEVIRNTSVLITGTVLAQLIALLLQPVIRRMFPAEAFGSFVVYTSIIGLITVVSSFRYDDAVVIPGSDKHSVNLIFLSLSISMAINLVLMGIIIVFKSRLIAFLNLPSGFPAIVLYIIPLAAFMVNSFQCFNSWLIRKQRFNQVSVNKMVRRGGEGISQVSFGLTTPGNGLIYSDLIGQAANVTTAVWQSLKAGLDLKLVSISGLKNVAKKYSEFPRFNLIPAFMSACSFYLPPVFINKFFSPESAGYFDLTKMLLSVPVAFVAASLSSVLLQKTSERFRVGASILSELKPVIYLVLLLSVAEIIVIFFWGESIFSFVFGDEWAMSGRISTILVWSFALNFIVTSFSSLFIAMRRIKIYSIWQALYFLAILSLLLFRELDFTGFLMLYVIIEVICFMAIIGLLISIIARYEISILKSGK